MDKDRKPPKTMLIWLQLCLLACSLFNVCDMTMSGNYPSGLVWACIGFHSSLVSMWVAEWVYARWSARYGSMAMAMLPGFENQQYKTREDMAKDLDEICRHVEKSTIYLVVPYHYVDGWKRTMAMAGGVASLFMLSVAALRPEDYLLSISASLVFGFFAFKALYIILWDGSWISM
jgi:hypothetical protein